MTLHPQAEAFLDYLKSLGGVPIHTLSPEKNRTGMKHLTKRTSILPQAVANIEDRVIPVDDGEIKLRIYTPEGQGPFPILVYFHGGGWVMGDLETADGLVCALTNAAKAVVVSVDYRLAPEYKFPTAVNDCYLATKWVWENAVLLGGDGGRVAVGGESAGGNLAAVVSIMARDLGCPSLCLQVLIYPITDISREYPSQHKFNSYFLTGDDIRYFEEHYLRTDADRQNNHVSPLLTDSLSNLAPALVITAGYDPLHDQGEVYAKRLKEAGVDLTYYCYEDMIHGFLGFAGIMDKGKDLIEMVAWSINGK